MTGLEIDRAVKSELRTLSKDNAQGVGAHLVMVARLLDDDIELARAHADAAVRRAGRVPSVREARGMVAYHEGEWALALAEFRTARRLSGSHHLLPYLVDCERALGRPEKALDLARSPEASSLPAAERAEIAIVISGIRRDMGQPEAALTILEGPHLVPGRRETWAPRMYYAYADALLELGRDDEARQWFQAAADVDDDLQTDAWERLDEMDGTVLVDLMDGADESDADGTGDIDDVDDAEESDAEGTGDAADDAGQSDAADVHDPGADGGDPGADGGDPGADGDDSDAGDSDAEGGQSGADRGESGTDSDESDAAAGDGDGDEDVDGGKTDAAVESDETVAPVDEADIESVDREVTGEADESAAAAQPREDRRADGV